MPDSECPDGWTGLEVTTENDAEVEYLENIPACTDAGQDTTYLENRSDAVWILTATGSTDGSVTPVEQTWAEFSFENAAREVHTRSGVLVPDAEVTVDLPPGEVEWVIDLPLSIGWQGHAVVWDKIESLGSEAVIDAARRQSQAGAALAACTVAVIEYANTVTDLEDADATEVLVDGLGAGVASSTCHNEARTVRVLDATTGQPVALVDDLGRLRQQTAVLGVVETRLTFAQHASKALNLGLKLLPRG